MRPFARLASPFVFATSLAFAQNQGLTLANGNVGYVDVPSAPSLQPTAGITVEAWITYNAALGTGWRFPTIVRKDPTPNVATYFLRVEAGQTQANVVKWWVGTTNGNFSVNWNFPAGALANWTHLAATYDGSTIRIVADGVQVAQAAASGTLLVTSGPLRIGSGDLSVLGGETWNGEIDELRIWPFARSAAEIAATRTMRLSSLPGQVSTWNLDGDASDSSAGNAGNASGTAAFGTNTLVLQDQSSPSLFGFGSGTGCSTNGLSAMSSLANLGNAAFSFVGTGAPANALGLLLVATNGFPSPIPVLGFDLWADPTAGVLVPAPANAFGSVTIGLPIPNTASLPGFSMYSQFAWLDGCAGGFSASGALLTIVVP